MSRILKKDALDIANTFKRLLAVVNVTDRRSQKHSKHGALGFGAQDSIQRAADNKSATQLYVLSFKNNCIEFMLDIVVELLGKCGF